MDGVEVDAAIQDERAVKFGFPHRSVRVKMQAQKEKEKKLYAGKKLFDGKDRPAPKKAPASSCCDTPGEGSCCPPPPPEADSPPPAEQ